MTSPTARASARSPIPLAAPEIRGNEWKYIKECLDTGWVSSAGDFVNRFEQEVAKRIGVDHAVATASGTAALHIALLVAGIEPEDEVLVSTLTFIAPANAIRYLGAFPVFIDVEPDFWQMDPQQVVDFLEKECRWHDGKLYNRTTGRRVRAILPVHILGHPVDMESILAVARRYDLVVVEDATEGLGALYNGRPLGSLGDIACFSFNGNKIITTGGGGMIVTGRRDWAERARYLITQAKDDPVEYIHNEIGFNYRLTNIQAAMGCAQLEQLGDYVAAKRRIASAYDKGFRGAPGISLMNEADWAFSTFWLYTVLVDQRRYGMDSRELLRRLDQAGIQTRPLWQPLHRSSAHTDAQAVNGAVAERLYQQGLSLPCSVGLAAGDQQRVCGAVREMALDA